MELHIKCPQCKDVELSRGGLTINGTDIKMVNRCIRCGFWMMIVIPPREKLDMKIMTEYPEGVQFTA
jgi:hypothetical protein